MTKVRVKSGDTVWLPMPWSEVCMHLRIADQLRNVRITSEGAQILNDDGTRFSFEITYGEAGIFSDADGLYINQEEEVCPSPQMPPSTDGATSSPAEPREVR
jgi:hypothetical protein